MARMRYRLERVRVVPEGARDASWDFAGQSMTGTAHAFAVTDDNFPRRNLWRFIVRVPAGTAERIEVRPTAVPNVRVWAQLDRRGLTFNRATKGKYRGLRYCQIALADPSGARTRDVVHSGEQDDLPAWFGEFAGRIRRKDTVRATAGTDGHALVLVVDAGDFALMIRVYFALKVWILKEGVTLPGPG